jgi:two-component system, chemotaxis family, CheB/CheR fusion protein
MPSKRKLKKENRRVSSPKEPRDSGRPSETPDAKASMKGNGGTRISGREFTPNIFPIVGIGASAGGLEAFTELLENLPADTGMAFVLVQHLDPAHESSLSRILSQKTSMPVKEVKPNTAVEPNHVYIIPPNMKMTISGAVLKLVRGGSKPGARHSIDQFFESLARDRGPQAVGVILSGSASDGTLGLEAIRNEGGIAMVQDESAKFESMPRNAIATGCADMVLPPKQIAQELGMIARHRPIIVAEPELPGHPAQNEISYQKILHLLRARFGVDLTYYRPSPLKRRMARRMVLNKIPGFSAYAAFLRNHPEELGSLYQDVLIHVTGFFRDPEIFELLKRKIFPKILKTRNLEEPVRVWVLGCSTGQEAYSYAMLFQEFLAKEHRQVAIQIFGTDLNETLLDQARLGLYSNSQMQGVSPERLRQFFIKEDGGYRISKIIRETCVFAKHDMLNDPPFSRMDLLSCRNVMIYLEPGLQKQLIPAFYYSLKPGGILVLGKSENITGFSEYFSSEHKAHKIYAKKANLELRPFRLQQSADPIGKSSDGPQTRSLSAALGGEMDIQKEADRVLLSKYAPAAVLVDEAMQILQFRGKTGPFLEPAPGKPGYNLLKMAREGLVMPLRKALQEAREKNETVRTGEITFRYAEQSRKVHLEIVPLKSLQAGSYLVIFDPGSGRAGSRKQVAPELPQPLPSDLKEVVRENSRLRDEISGLKDYLQSVTEQYEAVNEELQSANEEGQSTNEELQSINEELETTKEELQSTNEELITVNDEMNHRNLELHHINNDLHNVLAGVQMCIVVLGSDLCIRRFTPLAEKILNLVSTDVGRPITNINPNFEFPDLKNAILEVINHVRPKEEEVQDKEGRWYSLRLLPYKTSEKKIEGAVLVLVDVDELKRSEQRTKEARDYAEAIVEAVREPLIILDQQLQVESANRSFYKIFQTSPEETGGRFIFEIQGGQWNLPDLRTALHEVLLKNSPFDNFEVMREFQHLGSRTMLLNARPMRSIVDHQSNRILLAIEDVTERKQLEVIRESEYRFRTLAEALPQLVWTCFPDGQCDYFNTQWTDYTGRSPDELLGLEWREALHPDDRNFTYDQWIDALHGKVPYDLEYRIRRVDGQYHWFKVRATPLRDSAGKILKWFGTSTDIEDQKRAHLLLQESENWLRLIMESVRDFAIFTIDAEGRVVDWNSGAEGVFGFSEEEILGRHADLIFSPEDRANGVPAREIATAAASGCALDERWHMRKDGSPLFVSGALRAIRDEHGTLRGFTKVARDITERKQHEEELKKARDELEKKVAERTLQLRETVQELEAFSYSVSHDLRSPLRAMLGFAHLALMEGGEQIPPSSKDFLERIINAANRLDRLIQDILAYSRMSATEMRLEPLDLEKLTREVIDQYPGLQPVNVEIQIVSPLLPVMGHEASLTQCIANLLSNAIKFVRPGVPPRITVSTEAVDGMVKFWVADNGIGIDPANLTRIFSMFERVHAAQEYEGTGIGLSILRKAAERMGGSVGVESELGKGSRFWIQLKGANLP